MRGRDGESQPCSQPSPQACCAEPGFPVSLFILTDVGCAVSPAQLEAPGGQTSVFFLPDTEQVLNKACRRHQLVTCLRPCASVGCLCPRADPQDPECDLARIRDGYRGPQAKARS